MLLKADKNIARKKRHSRIRSHIHGTAQIPRLNVFRSLSHIYTQIIDDDLQVTITAASSLDKDFIGNGANIDGAKLVGANIAKKALAAGISQVVFDRGGYFYHGRIKALADAARNAGLKF